MVLGATGRIGAELGRVDPELAGCPEELELELEAAGADGWLGVCRGCFVGGNSKDTFLRVAVVLGRSLVVCLSRGLRQGLGERVLSQSWLSSGSVSASTSLSESSGNSGMLWSWLFGGCCCGSVVGVLSEGAVFVALDVARCGGAVGSWSCGGSIG